MQGNESQGIVYLDINDDLLSVLSCLKVNKISHVPIAAGDKVIGIVSKTDVVDFLHGALDDHAGDSYDTVLRSASVKEIMIQPVVEAAVTESLPRILEKLITHQVSSVVLKDNGTVVGILTETDMLRYLAKELEGNLSFPEKLGLHVAEWLDRHGLIKISRMLSDVGI